jgi:hypothetical protein
MCGRRQRLSEKAAKVVIWQVEYTAVLIHYLILNKIVVTRHPFFFVPTNPS